MFKKLFSLALVPAAVFAGDILNTKPGYFQIGVHGGPSFKDFDTRAKTGINSNNGYLFGAHVEIGGNIDRGKGKARCGGLGLGRG